MIFNSIEFGIFLPIVFILYWLARKSIKLQNIIVLVASYVFYGWWDWRFLSLIFFSSCVDYIIGRSLSTEKNIQKRKVHLSISLFVNLGLLGVFKYYNFFLDNFVQAFSFFGSSIHVNSLQIILPVGISFYTFQTLSYTIDVYRDKIEAENSFLSFLAYVSFFPQLVAGPIERATNLLPQFKNPRVFEYDKAVDGMRQILWGLFKKVVIADNCAYYANLIFENHEVYSGSSLLLGGIFFAFQIYGDFSGYSDIAIGVAKLFGFNLMRNFAFPYFSRDIAEFWRRWHISLSTWFRDYLYIPLGGSKGGNKMRIRNTFIIFIVSGFWHGANWTFIIWGLLNALYFLPLLLANRNRKNLDQVASQSIFPSLREILQMGVTFFLTVIAWIFFRAESVSQAISILKEVFSSTLFTFPQVKPRDMFFLIILFLVIEWLQRKNQHGLEFTSSRLPMTLRWGGYITVIFTIVWMGGEQQDFIYFQF